MSARAYTAACGWILCASAATAGTENEVAPPVEETGYVDRLIDGGSLPADVSADQFSGQNPDGWPRAMFIEGLTSRVTHGDIDYDESGIRLGGMLDTPDYGAFTLDANYRNSNAERYDTGNLFTLVQRGMPMDGGWLVNNALGVSNTPASDLARRQYRFFVPTIAMNGVATEWRQGQRLELHASYGEPGLLAGIYVPTFEGLHGWQASGGLQSNFTDEWSAAVQVIDVSRVRTNLADPSERLSSRTWFGAMAWDTPDAMAQLNVVESTIDGNSGEFGGWLDSAIRIGRTWHTMGAFYLDPELVWGNQPLASDSKGGYYRLAYQDRQWALDGGVDYAGSVSGQGDSTLFGTGYARYQYSSWLGLGGGVNIRQSDSSAWSTFGFADVANRWGVGRGQLGYARDDTRDSTQLTLDQTWKVQAGRRLSTAVAVGHENLGAYSADTVGLAVYGGGDLTGTLSLDVSARWDSTFGEASADSWLANVALNWTFAPGWLASANFYGNQGSGRLPLTVDSPIPGEQPYERLRTDESGFYVSIRYDWRAGTPSAPLGGQVGSGSGSIAGVLYLDANDNGRLDAGEAGAPNVVVLLDGKFQARTDADGRFKFPAVVAGDHVLTVVPDNLPLAWTIPSGARAEVHVGVRSETRVELAARRLR